MAASYDRAVIKAVLFDFNGVLVDDERVHCDTLLRVLAEVGIKLSPQEYFRDFVGLDDRTCFASALDRVGRAASGIAVMRLVARKAAYYRERIQNEGYRFFPGALSLIGELHGANTMLGVVSGALREEVEAGLAESGMRSAFKVLITAEDVTEGKPAAQGYRLALRELNSQTPLPPTLIHPHQALAIEDTPEGIAAAHDAGLLTLGVGHTYRAAELDDADVVVDNLASLDRYRFQSLFEEMSRR